MKIWFALSLMSLVLTAQEGALAAPAPAPPPQSGYGTHPEDHGPDVAAGAARADHRAGATRVVRRPAATRRRWRMTAGHIKKCRHRYKTYNPRTNRYVARPGLRRRCVL